MDGNLLVCTLRRQSACIYLIRNSIKKPNRFVFSWALDSEYGVLRRGEAEAAMKKHTH
ncbi:hypothetical protein [Spirosoma terrae]